MYVFPAELRHSSAGEERTFPCDICSAVFNTKGNLNRHRGRHDSNAVLPFVCETCGKNFKVILTFTIINSKWGFKLAVKIFDRAVSTFTKY